MDPKSTWNKEEYHLYSESKMFNMSFLQDHKEGN